jgi:hypothetical protein
MGDDRRGLEIVDLRRDQVGPTLQVVFDPVRNPDKDTVYVWGIRTRIEF